MPTLIPIGYTTPLHSKSLTCQFTASIQVKARHKDCDIPAFSGPTCPLQQLLN